MPPQKVTTIKTTTQKTPKQKISHSDKASNSDESVFFSSKQSEVFRDCGIDFVLTSRLCGVSTPPYHSLNLAYHTHDNNVCDNLANVAHNRAKILFTYFPQKTLIFCNQIHSSVILACAESSYDKATKSAQNLQNQHSLQERNLGQGDGIFCTHKNLVALILVADCNPMLIFDCVNGAFVALHAGRAGVCAHILTNGINTLLENGAKTQNLRVFIGASIRKCCYEVGEDLAIQIQKDFGKKYIEKRSGKYFLDLILMLLDECDRAGILRENIEVLEVCSCCEDRLFSYRRAYKESRGQKAQIRSQKTSESCEKNLIQTGRFGLFVSLR